MILELRRFLQFMVGLAHQLQPFFRLPAQLMLVCMPCFFNFLLRLADRMLRRGKIRVPAGINIHFGLLAKVTPRKTKAIKSSPTM
jgi:hypothetical protein